MGGVALLENEKKWGKKGESPLTMDDLFKNRFQNCCQQMAAEKKIRH